MRPFFVLVALALLAPVAHAGAACPALPEIACVADAGPDGASVGVGVKDVAVGVDARQPAGPGAHVAGAAVERYGDDELGELVVSASLDCWHLDDGCTPVTFAGTHVAPQGHDLRAGSYGPNRGGSTSYEGDVAGHAFVFRAGTFYFNHQQYGYIEIRVDGMGHEEFGGFPTFFL